MQTRFDNSMTAHVWAAQTQERGQSHNGNLYFEGRAIFSYGTHYCAGYVAGDGATRVYLFEANGASVTTNGKHMPAVHRAIPGRGYSCPNLDSTRYELEWARRDKTAAQRVQRLAKHLESRLGIYWPGAESAAAIFRAMGASDAEATRRANAGQKRQNAAERKRAAKAARAELDSNAKDAKRLARRSPDESARWARDELGTAAGESHWQQERRVAEVKAESREAFRAAKAAKAKGWPRVAAAARAHYAAMRAELKRWETDCERYAIRAAVRNAIQSVRAFPEQQARAVASDTAPAGMARGYEQLRGYLLQIAACPYVDESGPFAQRLATEAGKARVLAEEYARQANAARMAEQAEARAAWLAGGPMTYQAGNMADEQGGALLRAVDVQSDDSGAIIGGTLETSWRASVPLAHAIRAFRFLKLCRESGKGWAANGRTIRVGHFRVDSVDERGNLVAGCHRINWAECSRIAESLGLAELAADDTTESSRGAA